MQGDLSSDLKLPPAPASTSVASSADLVSMEGLGIMGKKHLPAGLGHRVLGSQDGSLPQSLTLIPTSLSNKRAPTFCCMDQGCFQAHADCPPRHTYGSAGLSMEDQSPHSHPFLNAQIMLLSPQMMLFPSICEGSKGAKFVAENLSPEVPPSHSGILRSLEASQVPVNTRF